MSEVGSLERLLGLPHGSSSAAFLGRLAGSECETVGLLIRVLVMLASALRAMPQCPPFPRAFVSTLMLSWCLPTSFGLSQESQIHEA